VIADQRRDDPERNRIKHILATIEERLDIARQVSAAHLNDETFTRQRFSEMADDLAFAHDMIRDLQDALYALLTNPPPAAVIDAMRSQAGGWHPVRWRIGGKMRSFLVPSFGRVDPIAEARWWRQITEQYEGGACS